MSFLSWNCSNGIANKIDNIRVVMDKFVPEIAFIHEAEITENQLGPCQIKGYDLLTANTISVGKSRTVCYRLKNSGFKQAQIKQENLIDMIVLENLDTILIGLYRGFKLPENCLPAEFFQRYLDEINKYSNSWKEIIVMGDFNIDPKRDVSKWNGRMLENFILSNGLKQHVRGTTRRRIILKKNGSYSTQESLIDLVLSRDIKPKKVTKKSDYVSDHCIILVQCEASRLPNITKKFQIRDLTKLNQHNILREAFKKPNITTLDEINNLHEEIYEKLAPIRSARTRNPLQLINPRIEKIKKRRDRLYQDYKRTGNLDILMSVKNETKRLKKAIKRERKIVIENKSKSPNTNTFWDFVKVLQGRKDKIVIDHIKDGDKTIGTDAEIAEALANFFKHKVDSLRAGHAPIQDLSGEMDTLKQRKIITKFNKADVETALKSFKGKLSSGVDGIPAKIVKMSSPALIGIYVDLFNKVLENGLPPPVENC